MFNIVKKEIDWNGKKLSIETGKIARQADGAVILRSGDTVILATAVAAKKANPETDFFPLTVNYQEKYYAAGKIPGGYFKREARPTEAETLISRLIDRPIRPLFPSSFRKLEGNRGLIGLSINLEIKVSASVGLASLLKYPPGIFPAA